MTFNNPYLFLLALSTTWSLINCRPNTNQRPICQTEACKKTAQMILNNMDKTTDPCDDFYQYVCGGFISKNEIPENKTSISMLGALNDLLNSQIRQLPKEPIDPADSESVRKFKKLYLACMDTEAIEELGISEVLMDFKKLGGWPVIEGDAWKEEEFDWVQTILKMEELGYKSEYLFALHVNVNDNDLMKMELSIAPPDFERYMLFLRTETSSQEFRAYSSYVKDMAKLFGAKEDRVDEELEEVIRFEIQLAEIFLLIKNEADISMSLREVNKSFSYFPWLDYVNYRSSSKLNGSEIVNVAPKYLEKFGQLSSKTSKRVLANFLFTKTVLDILDYLPEEFFKRSEKFQTEINRKFDRPPRNETCFELLENSFQFVISSLYVKKYFKKDTKKVVTVMANELLESSKQTIINATWMDKNTKENALAKLKDMRKMVAYPDELLDDEKIDEFYKDVIVDEKQYFMSLMSVAKFRKRTLFSQLTTPLPKAGWRSTGVVHDVNAFYNQRDNCILIPAGILQGACLNVDLPQYMNFGAIGIIIGHEITHGFDNQGSEYDKDGKRVDWWTPRVLEEFNKKSQCMIEQYNNVTVPEVDQNLNGYVCLRENIADNGGLKKAYAAYNRWLKTNGEEPLLPGIDLNPKQLFWVSNAHIWCRKIKEKMLSNEINTKDHSPYKYRINIPFGNSEEFINDFHCKEGTKMNPARKCAVW